MANTQRKHSALQAAIIRGHIQEQYVSFMQKAVHFAHTSDCAENTVAKIREPVLGYRDHPHVLGCPGSM
jgi:hypothetical protein